MNTMSVQSQRSRSGKFMSCPNQSLLSPTFYSKFDGLRTTTPTKVSSAPIQSRSTSKKVFELKKPESDIFTSPLNTISAPCSKVETEFEIYEDPCVDQGQVLLSPIETPQSADVNKENEDIPVSTSTSLSAGTTPLKEIPVASITSYQSLQNEAFRVVYSPMYKTKASPFQYTMMAPPSNETRTQGSLVYRATTRRLFTTKPDLTMNDRSPSTPLRVPDYIHSSRKLLRKVLPTEKKAQEPLLQKVEFNEEKTPKRYALRPRFTKPDYSLRKKRVSAVVV
jgi:hypothetical protein